MKEVMNLIVEENTKTRIDKYLSEKLDISRSKIQKLIEEDKVLVNGKSTGANYKVKLNDEIEVNDNLDFSINIEKEDMPIDIVYEDEYLLVINKKSGMVVHPGNGNDKHTLVNALVYHTNALSKENGNERPGIVHRIDKDTSGVLLIAKNDLVHNILAEGFKNKTIKRTYIALLKGEFPNESATIDAPIGRDKNNRLKNTVTKENSKEAITHLRVLKRYRGYTLAELKLETGRTHQIRVQMKYIGYPVYNDPVYTADKTSEFGQFLHAKSLQFEHPISKEMMYFESSLPSEFEDFISKLEEK